MTKKLSLHYIYMWKSSDWYTCTCNDLPHVAASWLTHNADFFVLISISNHHENKSGSIALSLVKIL